MADKFTSKGFADMELETIPKVNTVLDNINKIIEWRRIERRLSKKCNKSSASADGRPAYPLLVMFKILLLQRVYNLSDPQMEASLHDRLSFVRFVGLSLNSPKPDHSTICRFRQALLELNLYEELFQEINRQLEERGLLVREGAIVDATLITSARRPRKTIDIEEMPEDRKEKDTLQGEGVDETEETETKETDKEYKVSYSDDKNSSWVKKGTKAVYGQKAHIAVDHIDGYIIGGHMTAANVSDMNQLSPLLDRLELKEGALILADKGYSSKANREKIKSKGCVDFIMHKAARNRQLESFSKVINKAISQVRYKVERTIGALKKWHGFDRLRYVGDKKSDMEFYLNAMAFNLKKAGLKLMVN